MASNLNHVENTTSSGTVTKNRSYKVFRHWKRFCEDVIASNLFSFSGKDMIFHH